MIRWGIYLGIAAFCVLLIVEAMKESQERGAQLDRIEEVSQVDRSTAHIVERVQDMLFFEDQTSGLCFAYAWGGSGNGGPMLAHVPCGRSIHYIPVETGG